MKRIIVLLEKTIDFVVIKSGQFASILLVAISIFVFINVISRFVGVPLPWLFELTCFSLVILAFSGAAYALKEDKHVKVDFVRAHFSEEVNSILDIYVYIFSIVFFIILGWQGWLWAYDNFIFGVKSTTSVIKFPQWIFIIFIPLGCLLLCLQSLKILSSLIPYIINASRTDRQKQKKILVASLLIFAVFLAVVLFTKYIHMAIGTFFLLLLLLFSGTPIAFVMGIAGCFGLYQMFGPLQLCQAPILAFNLLNSFPLTSLPLFVFGGMIMSEARVAERVFNFVELWFRAVPAPLLVATIISGGIFCSLTGSSIASTAAMSVLCLPVLFEKGYNKELSCGAVAGSTVGTLIPPSSIFILYGIMVGESIGQLFMAGVGPGLVLFSLYIIYVTIRSIITKEQVRPSIKQATFKDKLSALKSGILGLIAPVIVLGGIYTGIFTPTEAGACLVVYGLMVGVFFMRTLKLKELKKCIIEGTNISLMILFIMACAIIYASVVSQSQYLQNLILFCEEINLSGAQFLIIMFFLILVLGMFIEGISMLLITLPLTYPLAMKLGINSIWFGVFYIINMEIALLTPPVGLNLFVIRGVTKIPLSRIAIGTIPFLLLMVLTLILIYFFPQVALWLPKTMVS